MNTEKINENMTLAEVVKIYPQVIPYLNDLHLDYCCGGHDPIHVIARERGTSAEELLKELNRIAEKPVNSKLDYDAELKRFQALTVSEMLTDLEQTHHIRERELMAEVEKFLNKILVVHYPHHGKELTALHHQYAMLKADLEEHFAREERLIFPLMRENPVPDQEMAALVKSLEEEHSTAGDLIKQIQKDTDNFTLPQDACGSYAHSFQLMSELFEDIFMHIFKENSIAFPEYYEKA